MRSTVRLFVLLLGAAVLAVAGRAASAGAEYAGSQACKGCHLEAWEQVFKSGHPWKIQKLEGGPPSYPDGTSPGVPKPPPDRSWGDLTYVIGGYGWKARFMDEEGYILTGEESRQYNLPNEHLALSAGWSGYSAKTAPRKPYTCGTCHTTGWVETGEQGPHQDGLPGIHGTWSETGVTCEACHGPSAKHASAPTKTKPSTDPNCSDCHIRGDVTQIDAKGGLVRHHEQYEDLLASPHKAFSCTTCHDPHKGTKYAQGGYKGDEATCKKCHSNVKVAVKAKENFACSTCHMPHAGKSAVAITVKYDGGEVKEGDIKSHIFRITTDPDWEFLTDDGKFVRVDQDGKAYLTLDRTCLTCHSAQSMAWAAENASKIHGK